MKGQLSATKVARKGVVPGIEGAVKDAQAYMSRLEAISRRRPVRGWSTEEIMRMTRGED